MDIIEKITTGAIAGVVSRTAVAPVERFYKGLSCFETIKQMLMHEGKTSLFKGNWANCVRIGPFQAIEFFAFDIYKKYLAKYLQFNRVGIDLIAGAFAGMTASVIVYPLDLAKTHMAINLQKGRTPGILQTLKEIVRNEGWRAMYKGLQATMLGIAPYASLKLTCYNNLQYLLSKHLNVDQKQMSLYYNLILGGISGCLAVTFTYPTDLIRRNLQVYKLRNSQSVTYLDFIKDIVKKNGISGLYTGLPATYLKLMPSTALVFATNDLLKQLTSNLKSTQ